MQIEEIAQREITMTLSPEDSMLLARACELALDHGLDTGPFDFGLHRLLESFHATLESSALAAVAYSYMCDERVTLTNLRAGDIGDNPEKRRETTESGIAAD